MADNSETSYNFYLLTHHVRCIQCNVGVPAHHSHNSSTRSEKLNYGNHTRVLSQHCGKPRIDKPHPQMSIMRLLTNSLDGVKSPNAEYQWILSDNFGKKSKILFDRYLYLIIDPFSSLMWIQYKYVDNMNFLHNFPERKCFLENLDSVMF